MLDSAVASFFEIYGLLRPLIPPKYMHASILAGASEDMNKYRFCGSAHAEFMTGTSSLLVFRSGEISF